MSRPRTFLPGATVGVMGSGQLGRMFAIAARRMGYRVHIFSPESDTPAGQLADREIAAPYEDEAAVTEFARGVDVLTFEFENIPAQTIAWCARECTVRPAGEVLETTQHRLREKEFLLAAGLPLAPFRRVDSADELRAAAAEIGLPAVLKTAAFGYDGKGQRALSAADDLAEVWRSFAGETAVLERFVDFSEELSVLVARGVDGAMQTFPVGRNEHRAHILDVTVVPFGNAAIEQSARALACAVAEKIDLVGLLAVELFLTRDGSLLINELAPRPHNSGHWTFDACVTSQFEQQLRAVCGLPLGATDLLRPAAMANLLGDLWENGEPLWDQAAAFPDVKIHLYGKSGPRPRRKMGHLVAFAETPQLAAERVRRRAPCAHAMLTETQPALTPAELAEAVERASALLLRGEPVALPTETVYGLAAHALQVDAVLKIFAAKERPFFDPLIVHLPDRAWLSRITAAPSPLATRLIERFWPGPLTLVLPRQKIVPDVVTAGLETVAVRMSAHPVFRAIIERTGQPLAAPSANRFGRISPTTAPHVQSELHGRIPLIVDGGPTLHGVESTIVAVEGETLRVLRSGPITSEELAEFGELRSPEKSAQPQAPGQMASHYAPRTPLQIAPTFPEKIAPRTALLAWRAAPPHTSFERVEVLSATGDLREAAATLFAKLRRLDEAQLDLILAEPVPERGLGVAIMDRLRKAAGRG